MRYSAEAEQRERDQQAVINERLDNIMLHAYAGQDILDLYYNALEKNSTITPEEIITWVKFGTKITLVQFYGQGNFQFRMETLIKDGWPPICQYVVVNCDGAMMFQKDLEQWFISGDMFKTFRLALDFLFNS
jgi:hypothetical protein